jgi:hypothetical protein
MRRQIFSFAEPLDRNIAETRVSFDTDGLDARADWLAHPRHLLSFGMNAWQMQASPARLIAGRSAHVQHPGTQRSLRGRAHRGLGILRAGRHVVRRHQRARRPEN